MVELVETSPATGFDELKQGAAALIGTSPMARVAVVARCYPLGMSRASQPTRLPADVYESAVAAAPIASRTVPEQVAYWARIGREFEMSPQVNQRAIARVLAGDGSYDLLGEREQAVVRAVWSERLRARREGLNYEADFIAEGESYSEADEAGNVIVHTAGR